MSKTVSSLALALGAALLLSACGLLAGLVPDQELPDGVLGLGGGVQVALEPQGLNSAIEVTQTETIWIGTIEETLALDALTGIPNAVSPDGITETIELGDAVVVRNPASPTGPFTVTGLALGGTFTIGTTTYNVPAGLSVDGLAVAFADPVCVDDEGVQECTYTTASNLPSLDVVFTTPQVAAYWNLLRTSGGNVSVDLTVTVTLADPGLPSTATVIVTIDSGGATITF